MSPCSRPESANVADSSSIISVAESVSGTISACSESRITGAGSDAKPLLDQLSSREPSVATILPPASRQMQCIMGRLGSSLMKRVT